MQYTLTQFYDIHTFYNQWMNFGELSVKNSYPQVEVTTMLNGGHWTMPSVKCNIGHSDITELDG